MKWATVLLFLVMAAATGVVYWVMTTLRQPGSPVAAEQTETLPPPEAKPVPRSVPPPPSVAIPVPEVDQAAVTAAVTAPPQVTITPPPPLPFPRVDQIKIGSNREDILNKYQEPSIRSITNIHGDLLETYVYKTEASPDTWVVLRNGEVAATFTSSPIPKQRKGQTAPGLPRH